jgi:hypothetical protein
MGARGRHRVNLSDLVAVRGDRLLAATLHMLGRSRTTYALVAFLMLFLKESVFLYTRVKCIAAK